MSLPGLVGVELVSRSAPLGVRFFDGLTRSYVADGLLVNAVTLAPPPESRDAVANDSGIFVFHELPRLGRFELPDRDTNASFSAPRLALRVEVRDRLGRFVPFSFETAAPVRGLLDLDLAAGGSFTRPSDAPAGSIELFSAPARNAALIYARVRAELRDASTGDPAAFALVEARLDDGSGHFGLCDAAGRVAIFFAYPQPTDLPLGSLSTPIPLCPPLIEQTWRVDLAIHYQPRPRGESPPPLADLPAALTQPPALVWRDRTASEPLGSLELRFGRELVAGKDAVDPSRDVPNLWVTPA
ncbi:MAG TPA: hypothetical protein VGQ57_18950 [Polyangiaceae bacterium]|jgi:hypothetical protein|nr:hypothetical protein [Polyangiaceae bacterium]